MKQMSYSKNFEDKVLEFMKDMNEFVKEQKSLIENKENSIKKLIKD